MISPPVLDHCGMARLQCKNPEVPNGRTRPAGLFRVSRKLLSCWLHLKGLEGPRSHTWTCRAYQSLACLHQEKGEDDGADLEELKGAALLQLLEDGAQVAPAAARTLHVCLVALPPEQHARRVRKVLLEREEVLQ